MNILLKERESKAIWALFVLHFLILSLFLSPASDTEQDAAVRLDQERADIVAKYDKVEANPALLFPSARTGVLVSFYRCFPP